MSHLLARSTATPGVSSARSAVDSTQRNSTPVLISEQEVVLSTAAAAAATLTPPATTRRHWRGTTLIAAIGRIHIGLPEPRPCYPRRDASYFEEARMSRHMDHL
jgi:hypothetical protein